jgi:hypothetical protein
MKNQKSRNNAKAERRRPTPKVEIIFNGIRGRVEMIFIEDSGRRDTRCCQTPRWGSAQ